jgi:hypothetical protein
MRKPTQNNINKSIPWGKDEQSIFLFLMDAGLLTSVKYTRHLQYDNITLLVYKPFNWSFHFIWEIIIFEALN